MAQDPPQTTTAYDEVPYESFPFAQSHPRRLATLATLLGMSPAPLDNCRVLELGSSSGGNLLPIAEQFPQSHFVGVDASSRATSEGQQVVESLGLTNVRLLHQEILALGPELGSFDYIITHGVYAWVQPKVQDKILELIAELLRPNGVAYVSYNTYPGWRMRGMIRDLMQYRASFFTSPSDKLREGRALVDFLSESVPTENNAYGMLLRDELNLLRSKEDWYLFHDYLEEENRPEYFHEFIARAKSKGLQYLAEADFSTMSASNFPPQVAAKLRQLATDVVQNEQYMDFVRNRLFRQTLLCHAEVALDRSIPPERIYQMFVASSAEPEDPQLEVRSTARTVFRRPGSTLSTNEPLVKAAMLQLRAAWPRPIGFFNLLAAARARLHPGPLAVDAERDARDARTLAQTMIRCYSTTHVDLTAQPPRFSLDIGEKPRAAALARRQAHHGKAVTNLAHETARLTDLQRHLLRFLDGSRDRAALLEILAGEVFSGRLVVRDQGEAVQKPDRVRSILGQILEENLRELGQKAFLQLD